MEACQTGALNFQQRDVEDKLRVGAIILAPGFKPYDPSHLASYLPLNENVLTSLEMERLQCASGPTGGEILRSDGKVPERIAWLQCVGSRSLKELPYCSGVCCAYAVKQAMIVKDHNPDIECHIFFHEERSFGKGYEAFFRRGEREYGIRYHRLREPLVREGDDGKLLLQVTPPGGGLESLPFDMVVLSTGFAPPSDGQVFKEMGVQLNQYGYVDSGIFRPVETAREGVYVCGAFTGPRDIPETVAQASAAAALAASLLADARGTLVVEKEYPEEKEIGEQPRIGVFVCHCGTNIAAMVDVESVRDYAAQLPGVVYAEDNVYTCSAEGCERIREAIISQDLNRVVVAACTPRTHEPLFRETCREAGLNRYLFEMANIRDQCSWVHRDRREATIKAKNLVRAAVAKSALLKPLPTYDIPVHPSALVIGGGLSGLTAAESLANQGFEVHVVEKKKNLGGNLLLHYTTLAGDNPRERVAELVSRVGSHERIHVHTGARLTGVSGYVGNFTVGFKQDGKEDAVEVGAIIVATGGRESKPVGYLYGEDPRVITQAEAERELYDRGELGNTVVMIQCVGSRNQQRPYCSRVCCTLALKNALSVKEKNPDAEVIVAYRDIMAYGFKEDHYRKAREKGVLFVRFQEEAPPEVYREGDKLLVRMKPAFLGEELEMEADKVVLSCAIVPSEEAKEISEMLKVPVDDYGFFTEAHIKLRPVDFATDGIFVCGVAHSPKTISENIAQAQAAAARAARILSHKTFASEGMVARVDEEACRGCGTCVEVCPFGAIGLVKREETLVAEVNPALCKHCGTCSAACLSSAITTEHFTNEQIFAMIDAEMEV